MNQQPHFGLSNSICRTDTGALNSKEIEKIRYFLFRRGVLLGSCFDYQVVILHPGLIKDINKVLTDAGLQAIMLGASLASLRETAALSIAESRVLEALTPGSLIVMRSNSLEKDHLPVAIPDYYDLRDICNTYSGTMQVYFWKKKPGQQELQEILFSLNLSKYNISQVGVLECPSYEEEIQPDVATIVRILGPGDVQCIAEGQFDIGMIEAASKSISIWEMGEWT